MFSSIGKKTGSVLVALLTAFAITTSAVPAHATTLATGNVNVIEVTNNVLLINLSNGVQYKVATTGVPAGCTAVTSDQLKIMVSVAQAALLSGKKINVYFDNCSGSNYVPVIDLLN
ncbi:MAG: hypothetical protein ABW061_28885 [Polyangiaceae bacterium]